MPTTESSNNPHVRITRETHERIRTLSFLTGYSQGDLVDELVRERLAQMGNPHLKIKLPPRQRRQGGLAEQLRPQRSPANVRGTTSAPPPRRAPRQADPPKARRRTPKQ